MSSNYKVITSKKSNYKIITLGDFFQKKLKSNYKVITKTLLYYIVITFSLPAFSLTFQSELTDGQLVYGQIDENETVFVENSYLNIGKNDKKLFRIQTNAQGKFAIGIPQDATQLKLTIKTSTHSKQKTFTVKPRQWNEEYVTGLPSQKVEPNQDDTKRITSESLQMKQARQTSTYPFFPEKWTNPVPDYKRISSHFGSRRILNNVKKQGHSGTDLAAPIDTPIYAPADGKVVLIHPDMFLTGKTILIDHGFGIFSSYSHLNQINVKLNQEVKQGNIIGKVGQTGRATGPHLHWTITWYGIRVNPEDLIEK